jgi:hypothetical protein
MVRQGDASLFAELSARLFMAIYSCVHSAGIINDLSSDYGKHGFCLRHFGYWDSEDVLRENSEIRQFTRLKAAFVLLGKLRRAEVAV